MAVLSRLIFLVTFLGAVAYVALTSDGLPERIASHFGLGGGANGFLERESYQRFMLALVAGIPAVTVFAVAGIPRLIPVRFFNLPNRDYWLAPERREATLVRLTRPAWWLGSLEALFLAGTHGFVVEANTHLPPRLAEGPFMAMLGVFLVLMVGLTVGWSLSFRRLPTVG